MKRGLTILLILVGFVLIYSLCSKSNNLLFGRVEGMVGGHRVVVTDCYRMKVPKPEKLDPTPGGKPAFRFMPCRDADVVILGEELSVNGKSFGHLADGDTVTVDHGRVLINGREPQNSGAGSA